MNFDRIEAAGERYVRDGTIVAASNAEGVEVEALRALILARSFVEKLPPRPSGLRPD
jgi:hypothetical protein